MVIYSGHTGHLVNTIEVALILYLGLVEGDPSSCAALGITGTGTAACGLVYSVQ